MSEWAKIYNEDGVLSATVMYDRANDQLATIVNPDRTVRVPILLRAYRQLGKTELGDKDTRNFLSNYVCPSGRQNIWMILKAAGLPEYNMFDIFCWANSEGLEGGYGLTYENAKLIPSEKSFVFENNCVSDLVR